MEIIKNKNCLKLSWESKITISKTKQSSNNNIKRDYFTYRTVFPLALYNYLDYENNNYIIEKLNKDVFKINIEKNNFDVNIKNKLVLKENNSNKSNNNSGKRMSLRKSIFGEYLLQNSEKVIFSIIFNFNNGKINEDYLIKMI